ncbi:hypothetical protein WI372_13455 [Gemmatimonadota bacterium DH-20]|uniref:Uncharacterized protein n=1 Tax=Gaopeijia maritima TaxID=3119007 RepID=A0ABU9ECZ1_9BACT
MRVLWAQTPFRNAFLRRGLLVWMILRVAAGGSGIADPHLLVEGWFVAIAAVAVTLDARRRNEDLFLANLGVPGWTISVLGGLAALVAEMVVP